MELTTVLEIYLWLLHEASWLAFPIVVMAMWLFVLVLPRVNIHSLAVTESYVAATPEKSGAESVKSRKDIRLQTKPTIHAELSDGNSTSLGVVMNISKDGMCIRGVSRSLSASHSQILVHVSDADRHFWVLATPRWTQDDFGGTQIIGLSISPSTSEWPQLVTSH